MTPSPDVTRLSDHDLAVRARDGDDEAYAVLMRRYESRVRHLITAIVRKPDAAEDLTQEAFFRAHTKLDTYRPGTSFPAWVTRIGKNAALDYVKLRRPDIVPLRGSPDATTGKALKALGFQVPNPTSDPSTARELDERRFRFALEHALRRLDRTDRRCFLMHVAEERSFEEISRSEGLPAGTVKTNVRRARLQLREMLQPWLGTDASPGPATQA
ncbi:MAG TPA: sigma-70 family RNA polymerase sigma factor [Gemmatimonadales bacterium]|nr:sigma-70 family RNA polymerase sigma factor [Gemmatimonadales bacterium]